jgi:hypothetical protein
MICLWGPLCWRPWDDLWMMHLVSFLGEGILSLWHYQHLFFLNKHSNFSSHQVLHKNNHHPEVISMSSTQWIPTTCIEFRIAPTTQHNTVHKAVKHCKANNNANSYLFPLSFTWKTNRETRTKRIENIKSPNYFSFWGLLVILLL